MGPFRRILLSLALVAGLVPATSFAQVPPPVPALPDTERRTSYSISGTTCACAVNFQLYGDSTDFQNWIEVWLNGVKVSFNDPSFGWTVTVPTQTLATRARPISDAVLTFNFAQTGTVQIVGARKPRRAVQFTEGGITARNLNVAVTDSIAMLRETWDYLARVPHAPPGQTLSVFPPAASCINQYLAFDATGAALACVGGSTATGAVVGPGSSAVGNLVLWNSTNGGLTKDGGPVTAYALTLLAAGNAGATYGLLGVLPCAQSEAFTGAVTKSAGSCVTAINYTTALTGGVSRTLADKLADVNSAFDFGVKCDGSTDDTTNLQRAINSTNIGGTLYIPKKTTTACITSATLTFPNPIHFICDPGVAIQPTSGLGSNAVLDFVGAPGGLTFPTIIEGCYIGSASANTRFGGIGMLFDTTTTGNFFRNLTIRNVTIKAGTLGNPGINMSNNATNNPNGGIFASQILNSEIEGGLSLSNVGDSIAIRDVIFPQNFTVGADNLGIVVVLVNGASGPAGNLLIDHINFSQAGGINIANGFAPILQNSEIEGEATLVGTALVNFSASSGTVTNPKIRNNQFQYSAGFGTPLLLNIAAGNTEVVLDGNAFSTPTSYTPVANASTTLQLGPNFWSVGAAAHISGTAAANTYGGG